MSPTMCARRRREAPSRRRGSGVSATCVTTAIVPPRRCPGAPRRGAGGPLRAGWVPSLPRVVYRARRAKARAGTDRWRVDDDRHTEHMPRGGRAPPHPQSRRLAAARRGGARGAGHDRSQRPVCARPRGARRRRRCSRRGARHDRARAAARSGRAGAADADARRPRWARAADGLALAAHDRRLLRRDLRPRERREAQRRPPRMSQPSLASSTPCRRSTSAGRP